MIRVVYIAHPITAPGQWQITRNIRAAEQIALELWLLGAAPICPGKNTENFDGGVPREVLFAGDLELVMRSDAVVAAPGWQWSAGAHGEVALALDLGKPLFRWVEDKAELIEWLGGNGDFPAPPVI